MTSANEHLYTSASRPGGPTPSATVSCAGGALLVAVDVRPHDSTAELRLRGELDAAASEDLRRHIGAVIDRHDPHRLLLDLSELSFADSSGLAVLVWAHQVMTGHGRQLRLHHPQSRVLRIMNIAGLHNRLHITEANAAARRRPPGSHRPHA
ncbi:anti-sigma factor antagonist [Actinomadura bangladeshensis]|uniref:Anti-sigma factor antagonist n=1 Tax=Actinomadura bangladeshensis TaxID=453573 RepID=A0A6L9QHZ2_9ACTN|nr:STAS domain-containing protein [Actinomadura bangladeshensis]